MWNIQYTKHYSSVEYKYFRLQLQIKCPINFTVYYVLRSYSDVKATNKIDWKFKTHTSITCLNSKV